MQLKHIAALASFAILGFTVTNCVHEKQPVEPGATWISTMHQLSDTLSILLPYSVNPNEFNKPENLATIKTQTQNLARLAREVTKDKSAPDGDPLITFSAVKFATEMTEANKQLSFGNLPFARYMIANATNYCITCHTRTNKGNQHFELGWNPKLDNFSSIGRAQFYLAIRQYDTALVELDKIATDEKIIKSNPKGWQQSVEKYLAVAVRVKRDPEMGIKFLNKILESEPVPVSFKFESLFWRRALQEWKKELAKPYANLPTRKMQFEKAQSLLKAATSVNLEKGNPGLVQALRASTLLHDLLHDKKTDNIYGESLYLSGLAAESLKDINLWTMHEAYYEACVRHAPHTVLAQKCYTNYEQLMLSDIYADKYDSFVPDYINAKLGELKALAARVPKVPNERHMFEIMDEFEHK